MTLERSNGSYEIPLEKCQSALRYYRRLAAVNEYVEEHYSERIGLETAAEVANLNPKYFSTFFHTKTGLKFTEWLGHVRITKAMELLATHNYAVTTVAFRVGYRNLRTFERGFKRIAGVTPTEFKRSVQPK